MRRRSVILIGHGLHGGGAQISMLRLAENFSARGYDTRVAVLQKQGDLLATLPSNLRVDEIGGGHVSCIPRLARYLRRHRADAIISFMTYPNVVSILAQLLSPSLRKVVVSEHSAFSRSIKIRGGVTKLFYLSVPLTYRWASSVICVSQGVKDDLASWAHLPARLLTTIYNPVVTDELLERSLAPPDHPWLIHKDRPVVLAVGRIDRPKNYPLLIDAFARLRSRLECRLLVLGDGELRDQIERKIALLGLGDCVHLAGFRSNSMSFMRRADALALSSDWEGLGNVLIEAMAVGCPVVSTDAPHGPREILQDGRLGRLVPVGNAEMFARALEGTLRAPGDPAPRMAWARTFTVDACADRYLSVAGLR